MKTKNNIRAKGLTLRVFFLGVFFLCISLNASAQEDVTPPVLLDFTISPTVFDASAADVVLNWCLTAKDDLSGLDRMIIINVGRVDIPGQGLPGQFSSSGPAFSPVGTLEGMICGTLLIPQYAPLGRYIVTFLLRDRVDNRLTASHPDCCQPGSFPVPPGEVNLCTIGVCELENRLSGELPDRDNDLIPDDADNCPDNPNTGQEDSDLDLIGDVCDSFPNDRDNEQAQCESDLAVCLENQVFSDSDDDGEADSTDLCPETPPDTEVDSDGCSLLQFCSAIDANSNYGRKICRSIDWKNDEPLENKGDCETVRQGFSDFSCVPR